MIGPISEDTLRGHKAHMFNEIALFFVALTRLVTAGREALEAQPRPPAK
jgi:hypothetical protein